MKLFIYQAKELATKTFLTLAQSGSSVYVSVVNEEGEPREDSYLLEFKSNGTMCRIGGVSERLGFKLDALGRIVIEEKD